jgi:hypothetical protein
MRQDILIAPGSGEPYIAFMLAGVPSLYNFEHSFWGNTC